MHPDEISALETLVRNRERAAVESLFVLLVAGAGVDAGDIEVQFAAAIGRCDDPTRAWWDAPCDCEVTG